MNAFRRIPPIDTLLAEPEVAALAETVGRGVVVHAARLATERVRAGLQAGTGESGDLAPQLCRSICELVAEGNRPSLRRVINATGVVLHTGLGRAVLSPEASDAVARTAAGHVLLEVDAATGERGSRLTHVAPLLRELTGAEDGLAVNNNAAAVYLAIAALAAGREVVIARGQLVEIGGSFRIPDVIRAAGARLVEVGTTNKVRVADYAAAIGPETALILRVHPSNFRIVGFTEEATLSELTALGRERGLPVMDDLGSGALLDLRPFGLVHEPLVQDSVRVGADVVTFSGDKLLGGPQAGLAVGRLELLARMRRHPMMRVVRVDKLTLAALEATLRAYRDPERATRTVPTLAALAASAEALRTRAEHLAAMLEGESVTVTVEEGRSQVGGGSLPGEELLTTLVCLTCEAPGVTELARRLRVGEPGVWSRLHRDRLLLDLRTVTEPEIAEIVQAIRVARANP